MTYVNGYLVPVPEGNREAYRAFSERVARVYREHGALRVVDCWLDPAAEDSAGFHAEGARETLDAESEGGRRFATAAGVRPGEVAVLSWTERPDKAVRDKGLKAALADPRIQPAPGEPEVFDGRRLISGGFEAGLDV